MRINPVYTLIFSNAICGGLFFGFLKVVPAIYGMILVNLVFLSIAAIKVKPASREQAYDQDIPVEMLNLPKEEPMLKYEDTKQNAMNDVTKWLLSPTK